MGPGQGRDGGKVDMGCVQEQLPYVQHPQATSAYISLHVVFGEIVHQGRSVLILALQMHSD